MTTAIAYAVRVIRTPKAGGSMECWLSTATMHGAAGQLASAMLFLSEEAARRAAESRTATIARIVPIVALELEQN
jgi:hypothetical protein